MSTLPERANVVVIGAGIVGNSLAYHLVEQGWTDVVLLDKGPFPSPGGSTGHASNFIFPVDHSKEMTLFTQESVRQYQALGVFTRSGGIEVARTARAAAGAEAPTCLGEVVGGAGRAPDAGRGAAARPVPRREGHPGRLLLSGVGVVDSLRAGTLMRERAQARGALTAVPNTEILGIDVEGGRVRAVRTSRGTIRTGRGGRLLRRLEPPDRPHGRGVDSPDARRPPDDRRRAGAALREDRRRDRVPDHPRHGHQHVRAPARGRAGDRLVRPPADPGGPRRHPLARAVGPVADPAPVHQGGLRPPDGAGARADAGHPRRRVGRASAWPSTASSRSRPTAPPSSARARRCEGLWSAAAIWIKEAPGIARTVAEWMTRGVPEIDPHGSDIARFYEHQRTKTHVHARTAEGYNKTYGIVHPAEQWGSNRDVRLVPLPRPRARAGRRLLRDRRLGAPALVRVQPAAARRVRRPRDAAARPSGTPAGGRRSSTPSTWRCATGSAWWTSPPSPSSTSPGRRPSTPCSGWWSTRWTWRSAAWSTPRCSTTTAASRPTSRSCGSATRRFRIVTGGGLGRVDRKWFVDHLPDGGSPRSRT